MSEFWYYAEGNETCGPIALDQLIERLSQLPGAGGVLVWREGFDGWKEAENVREIAEKLIRPPPLRQRSSVPIPNAEPPLEAAAGEVLADRTNPRPLERDLTVSRDQQQFGNVKSEQASAQNANTRGRIAFLVVFAIVVVLGAYFTSQIYGNSANGIAYLIGEFLGAWLLLTALTWWARKWAYTAAVVLAVAAFSVGLRNIGALQESNSVQEAKAALQGGADPKRIDEVLQRHPSNTLLQLMAMTNKAAIETNAAFDKLSAEIEPPALSKDINPATASRSDLEALRRDLKAAEANAAAFMSRSADLLKTERDKVENYAQSLHVGNDTVSGYLRGVDKRHATITAFNSKMMSARAEFYHAYQDSIAVLIEEYGAYKVVNGQFTFPQQRTADRFNVATSATTAAAKRLSELDNERKQIAQSQQEKWEQLVKGK